MSRFGKITSNKSVDDKLLPRSVIKYCKNLYFSSLNFFSKNYNTTDNSNNNILSALHELKLNTEIKVTTSDKGSKWVILAKNFHENETVNQLSSYEYGPLQHPRKNHLNLINKKYLKILKNIKKISNKEYYFLLPKASDADRKFRILPKIHKTNWPIRDKQPPGRPIVADVKTESSRVAKLIDFYLIQKQNLQITIDSLHPPK